MKNSNNDMQIIRKLSKICSIPYRIYFELTRFRNQRHRYDFPSENNGWMKYGDIPVWGNKDMGTMFDPFVYIEGEKFMMVVSARKQNKIILLESLDGKNWEQKQVLINGEKGKWDEVVNRGCLLQIKNRYYLWYTGLAKGKASIGLATSDDGIHFIRFSEQPVLTTHLPYEGLSAMNPCVLWDEEMQIFRMWYSAGETYEPDVICYAESRDGIKWKKHNQHILTKYSQHEWEQYKVGGCHVVHQKNGTFLIYYIGYQNVDVARICIAHSNDGINWERDENNLLIAPSKGAWDADATYKPTVVEKDGTLYMWYNGRKAHEEYIGLAKKQTK